MEDEFGLVVKFKMFDFEVFDCISIGFGGWVIFVFEFGFFCV